MRIFWPLLLPAGIFKLTSPCKVGTATVAPNAASQGLVNLKVPAGSKSGQKMRIAKRGLPKKHDAYGDLFAVLQIIVPSTLSDKERELFTALKENSSFNPRAHFDEELRNDT